MQIRRDPRTVSWGILTFRGWKSEEDPAKNTEEEKAKRQEDQECGAPPAK